MRGVGALVGGMQCKLVPALCVSMLWWCWHYNYVNVTTIMFLMSGDLTGLCLYMYAILIEI